jgi:hypothetical protein
MKIAVKFSGKISFPYFKKSGRKSSFSQAEEQTKLKTGFF